MKRALVVASVLALGLAASCSSSAKQSTGSTGSTSPANKITTVTLLAHSSFAVSKSVLAEFTRETGYKVKILNPNDAGVMVNQAILQKDHPVADAMFGVDNTFLTRAVGEGIFDQNQVTAIDSGYVCVIDDKAWFGTHGRPPPPASLDDLTKPAYKNLLVVENPATSSPGLAFLLATIAAKGEQGWQDYWRALKANGVRVVDDWEQAYSTDFTAGGGSGDRPIVVSYGSDPAADVVLSSPHRDTSHVGVLASTCLQQTEYAGVLHGAHNVPGAQALVQFMLSRTFQQDMPLQMYVYPVVKSAQLPPVFKQWAVVPAHPYTMSPAAISAGRDQWIKEWTAIVVG